MALVTCSYKTSNGSTFYRGNDYDRLDTESILLDAALSVEVLKAFPQMAAPQMEAAMLKAQYRLQVAPRSVASPVAWVVQALQGQWVLPALPGEVRRKPPPKAVSASAQAGQIWAVAGLRALWAMAALRLAGVSLEMMPAYFYPPNIKYL